MPFKKNDKLTIVIDKLNDLGQGVCLTFSKPIFVPFALVGEEIEINIIYVNSKFAVGKILNILKASKNRVKPKCEVFTKCGGCDLQHLKYSEQLEFKKQIVKNTLKIETKIDEVVPSKFEYEYRNKFSFPVVNKNGKAVIGMYARGSHRIIEVENCPIQEAWVKDVLEIVKNYIAQNNLMGYSEEDNSGLVRHIVARSYSGNLSLTFVLTSNHLSNVNMLVTSLLEKFKGISLYVNVNDKKSNVIFGKEFVHIAGEKQIIENLKGLSVDVVPVSFMQVNNYIRDKIYEKTLTEIKKIKVDTIVDAYSGAGLLTNILAGAFNEVYGVEIVKEAVEAANALTNKNNLQNKVTNICGDCGKKLPLLAKKLNEQNKNFAVVLDPPRKGCDENTINAILKTKPKRIVYIACGLKSLARDLKLLCKNDLYKIASVTPYDMFPQTKHIETLAVLELKS